MPKSLSNMRKKDLFTMNEDTVNLSVHAFLVQAGFTCPPPLTGSQHGCDVQGEKDGWRVLVESKGSHANHHDGNTVFGGGQIRKHISSQAGKLMEYMTAFPDHAIYVMANPDIERTRNRVERVADGIEKLGIVQFWVQADQSIEVVYPERIKAVLMELGLVHADKPSEIS